MGFAVERGDGRKEPIHGDAVPRLGFILATEFALIVSVSVLVATAAAVSATHRRRRLLNFLANQHMADGRIRCPSMAEIARGVSLPLWLTSLELRWLEKYRVVQRLEQRGQPAAFIAGARGING